MIFCGNIPPLQPLWDRYVTHKLDSNFQRTATSQYKLSGPSDGYSRSKGTDPYSQRSARIMASKNSTGDDESEHLSYKGIKARTDIHVSEESMRELV